MKQHSFQSHSAEAMRHLSNLGHIVEGALFAIVGALALLGNPGTFAWASSAWPPLILVAGIVLLLLLYARHPVSDWQAIWRDMQQRQHTIIAIAIAVAGLAELLRSSIPLLAYAWPAALILTGALFLFHAQHGTSEAASRAVRLHRILGITIIAAGLLRAVEVISGTAFAAILWPIVLLIAAAQLLLYREPSGAYEVGAEHGGPAGH